MAEPCLEVLLAWLLHVPGLSRAGPVADVGGHREAAWGLGDRQWTEGRGGVPVRAGTAHFCVCRDGGGGGRWRVAPGFPSPATMLEIQFIEFTVKVLQGFPGSFTLRKLLCWQFGGWCLVCLGEVESGPVLMESSSAWVTRGERAREPERDCQILRGDRLSPILVPNGSPPVSYLTIIPCGFQTSFSGEAVAEQG